MWGRWGEVRWGEVRWGGIGRGWEWVAVVSLLSYLTWPFGPTPGLLTNPCLESAEWVSGWVAASSSTLNTSTVSLSYSPLLSLTLFATPLTICSSLTPHSSLLTPLPLPHLSCPAKATAVMTMTSCHLLHELCLSSDVCDMWVCVLTARVLCPPSQEMVDWTPSEKWWGPCTAAGWSSATRCCCAWPPSASWSSCWPRWWARWPRTRSVCSGTQPPCRSTCSRWECCLMYAWSALVCVGAQICVVYC